MKNKFSKLTKAEVAQLEHLIRGVKVQSILYLCTWYHKNSAELKYGAPYFNIIENTHRLGYKHKESIRSLWICILFHI